jgi:hypothetical protein
LSGVRVIDATLPIGSLPGGYGVETYLNLSFGHAGRHIAVTDIGDLRGSLRADSNMVEVAVAVAEAILTSPRPPDESILSCGRIGTSGPTR